MNIKEPLEQFTSRKAEHIKIALRPENEAKGFSGLDNIQLVHEAIPDIDFSEIRIATSSLGMQLPSPFLVSSMTAGHKHGKEINIALAEACQKKGWLMGVGSQRRQLFDESAKQEWIDIKKAFPKTKMLGNIGIAQLIQCSSSDIKNILEPIEAVGLFVHANPLQECIQPEGTPNYRGSLKALENICKELDVPVILKETGCGFSKNTFKRLLNVGIKAIDVSGYGGTHWGRIEGQRAHTDSIHHSSSQAFNNWGISTVESVLNARECNLPFEVWGSGGVRTGLDAAKLIALGANIIGFAKPILEAAINLDPAQIIKFMNCKEYELKTALFCTNHPSIENFQQESLWHIKPR